MTDSFRLPTRNALHNPSGLAQYEQSPTVFSPQRNQPKAQGQRQRSQQVFFRHDGAIQRDLYLRINPTAIRFQQGRKGSVTETLGGYFREVFYSKNPQQNGLLLADLTIEATTGVAYRKELKTLDWIWRHSKDRKKDGTPADTYFFDNTQKAPYKGIVRSGSWAWLIDLENFAWDETAQSPDEIRITFRCKILRDLFWELDGEPVPPTAPTLEQVSSQFTSDRRLNLGNTFVGFGRSVADQSPLAGVLAGKKVVYGAAPSDAFSHSDSATAQAILNPTKVSVQKP